VSNFYLLFFQIGSDNLRTDNQRNSRLQPKVYNIMKNSKRSKNGLLSEGSLYYKGSEQNTVYLEALAVLLYAL
jgi:hypothetical protein